MGYHLIPNNLNIDFVGMRKISYALSVLLILIGLVSIVTKGGLRYGIDFAGGAVAQVKFSEPISDEKLKTSLQHADLPGLSIQSYGNDSMSYLLRISIVEESSTGIADTIKTALIENLGAVTFEIQRLEMVSPKVEADIRAKALEALYFATLITAIYISGRFEHRWTSAAIMAACLMGGMFALEYLGVSKVYLVFLALVVNILLCWRLKLVYALGALVSILHDVFIVVGIFSILNKEFDMTIIAALLTIVGFSLNDTIIVYDRIRENLFNNVTNEPLSVIINRSINQTMSRTILTSGTTLLVIAALLIMGGGTIFDFSLIMFLGVLIGTASSIFVASPVLLVFGDSIVNYAQKERDDRPRDKDGRVAGQV